MDLALAIEKIYLDAQYFGSTAENTKDEFDNLNWQDERQKPTWKQVQDAWVKYEKDLAKINANIASQTEQSDIDRRNYENNFNKYLLEAQRANLSGGIIQKVAGKHGTDLMDVIMNTVKSPNTITTAKDWLINNANAIPSIENWLRKKTGVNKYIGEVQYLKTSKDK